MATAGLPLALTSPGSWIHEDSDPRWTGAAKLRPPSVEQTATTWPIMSPDESGMVTQSQAAHTSPSGPAASSGPALASEGFTGPVIPPAEVARLFEPFQRLYPRGTRTRAGSDARNGHGHGHG